MLRVWLCARYGLVAGHGSNLGGLQEIQERNCSNHNNDGTDCSGAGSKFDSKLGITAVMLIREH